MRAKEKAQAEQEDAEENREIANKVLYRSVSYFSSYFH